MKKSFVLFILIGLFSLSAFADIAAPPDKPKEKAKELDAELVIYLDSNEKEAKLVISRETLEKLASKEVAPGKTASNYGSGFSRTQTLVSGLFLSLGLIFGGVWLARSKNLGNKAKTAIGIGVFAALGGCAASVAFANVAPPLYFRINNRVFSEGMQTERKAFGRVKIEIEEDGSGDRIRLIVPDEKKIETGSQKK